MKKVVISIPVHESSQVVQNQLENIRQFVPNSSVVLHASADSPDQFHQEIRAIIRKMDGFAYLNPMSFHTHSEHDAGMVRGLSTVHASNFKHIDSIIKLDIFALNTSNDMFVRGGINTVFEKFDCGFHVSCSTPQDYPYQDVIQHIQKYVQVKTCEKGSQEGTFYPTDVFREVSKIILDMGGLIKAEEMYLPCLAFNIAPELYLSNSGEHYVYHNPQHYSITKEDIHRVQYGELGPRYAVKRVRRDPNDPIRQYINQITRET